MLEWCLAMYLAGVSDLQPDLTTKVTALGTREMQCQQYWLCCLCIAGSVCSRMPAWGLGSPWRLSQAIAKLHVAACALLSSCETVPETAQFLCIHKGTSCCEEFDDLTCR